MMKTRDCRAALALALAATSGAVGAVPTLYEYTFWHVTNPYYVVSPGASEFTSFKGVFAGEDLDADGVIERPEVSLFKIGYGPQIVPTTTGHEGHGCIPDYSPTQCITYSSLDVFSYDLATGAFAAQAMLPGFEGARLQTGWGVSFDSPSSAGLDVSFRWTPDTYITVAALPVPEPATAALLAAGVALLSAGQRRRKGALRG